MGFDNWGDSPRFGEVGFLEPQKADDAVIAAALAAQAADRAAIDRREELLRDAAMAEQKAQHARLLRHFDEIGLPFTVRESVAYVELHGREFRAAVFVWVPGEFVDGKYVDGQPGWLASKEAIANSALALIELMQDEDAYEEEDDDE